MLKLEKKIKQLSQFIQNKRNTNKKGFTLIELIIVIAIIGILVAAAMMNMGHNTEKTRQAAAFSDMGTIATAVNVYYADTGTKLSGTLQTNCETLTNANLLQNCPKSPYPGQDYNFTFSDDLKVDITITTNEGTLDYLDHKINNG